MIADGYYLGINPFQFWTNFMFNYYTCPITSKPAQTCNSTIFFQFHFLMLNILYQLFHLLFQYFWRFEQILEQKKRISGMRESRSPKFRFIILRGGFTFIFILFIYLFILIFLQYAMLFMKHGILLNTVNTKLIV